MTSMPTTGLRKFIARISLFNAGLALAVWSLSISAQSASQSPPPKMAVASPTPASVKKTNNAINRRGKQPRTSEIARPTNDRELQPSWPQNEALPMSFSLSNDTRARELFEKAKTLLSQRKAAEALPLLGEAENIESNRFEIVFLKGVTLAILRQYDEAIRALQKAVRLNPRSAIGHSALCRAFAESNKRSDAIQACRTAVDLEPESVRYRTQLSALYILDERSADAIQLLDEIYARSQNDLFYLGTLADAYYMRGEYARAAELYERISQTWPDVSVSYFRLAGCYDYLDKGSLAIKAARRFVELEPRSFFSHYALGMTLKAFGFFEESIEPLTKAKSLRVDFGETYLALSESYEILGDRDNALANLRYAYERMPRTAELAYRYGATLIDYGNPVAALEPLKQANSLAPETPDIMRPLGLSYVEAGQFEKGIELIERAQLISPLPPGIVIDLSRVKARNEIIARFDELLEAVKKDPKNVKARTALGQVYVFKGMYDEAEREFLEVIKLNPDYRNYNGLGIFFDSRGQFDKAVEMYRKAIELNPHHVLYISLSFALSKLGRVDEALAAANRSVEIKSTLLESRIVLGDLYLRKSLRDDALREFQAAFEISPVDPRPNFKLVWLYIRTGNKDGAFRHYDILKRVVPNQLQNLELSLRAHFGQLP